MEITATAVSTDASCFGDDDGEVELSAEGGTGSFQYSDDGNSFGQDNEFDDLLAGTYNFFVQDENGCVESVEATIGEPEAIVVTGIVSEGSVTGEGTIDVTVTGAACHTRTSGLVQACLVKTAKTSKAFLRARTRWT